MAKFCRSCGTALKPDAKFCTKCGSAIATASRVQSAIEPETTAPADAVAASAAASGTAAAASPGESFDRRRKGAIIALVVAGVAVLFGTLLSMRGGETPTATRPVTAEKVPPAATPAPRDPRPPVARPVVASRWESYINTRYGVVIDYPADLFAIQPPPPDNAGRDFRAEQAGARFSIYSHANAMNFSVEELQAEDVLEIGDAAAVKQNGRDWYQIVAGKGDETILHRVLLSEGNTMVHRLEIATPKAGATAFGPIVARMAGSFRVDPAIPEKAARDAAPSAPPTPAAPAPPPASASAAKPAPPAQTGGYRQIDSISLGFRLAGAKSKVGFAVDVPADWAMAEGANHDSLFFAGRHPGYASEIVLAFIAEPRRAGDTLERKVAEQVAELDARSRKNVSQGAARIGLHPAILVAMPMGEFRKTFAYIEKDDHFYFVQLHAPSALYPKYAPVLERALASIAFAE
jgi:RNA polymerase subunit RPABC4/transcription elongation factor Spt4